MTSLKSKCSSILDRCLTSNPYDENKKLHCFKLWHLCSEDRISVPTSLLQCEEQYRSCNNNIPPYVQQFEYEYSCYRQWNDCKQLYSYIAVPQNNKYKAPILLKRVKEHKQKRSDAMDLFGKYESES